MTLRCFCRANLQKIAECSKRKLIQHEKNKPKDEHIDREDVAATPSTEGRAPNYSGRRGKMCFLKKEIKLQPYVTHPNILAALNATADIQRVRPRQSQLDKEDPSYLLSQVLNPELTLNNSSNLRTAAFIHNV